MACRQAAQTELDQEETWHSVQEAQIRTVGHLVVHRGQMALGEDPQDHQAARTALEAVARERFLIHISFKSFWTTNVNSEAYQEHHNSQAQGLQEEERRLLVGNWGCRLGGR